MHALCGVAPYGGAPLTSERGSGKRGRAQDDASLPFPELLLGCVLQQWTTSFLPGAGEGVQGKEEQHLGPVPLWPAMMGLPEPLVGQEGCMVLPSVTELSRKEAGSEAQAETLLQGDRASASLELAREEETGWKRAGSAAEHGREGLLWVSIPAGGQPSCAEGGVQKQQVLQGQGLQEQLRVLFLQALEQAMALRAAPPTLAQVRVEVPTWGQLVLVVALHGEQVHVRAEVPSPEVGWQFAASLESLQRLLGERQLRLAEVDVRMAQTSTPDHFAQAQQQKGTEEEFRERSRFVRSFRWHRTRVG